ncbi:zonular occludens toxin domain-containing protein [Massilia sp. SYSU DXS3249]
MAVYAITGKLGSGKGKGAMHVARQYLRAGKRVAGNMDVFMEHMDNERSRASYIRVPDKPTATDLYMLGSGNPFVKFTTDIRQTKDGLKGFAPTDMQLLDGFGEEHNGALFLDECGSWLNTRTYADKGRADLLEWMIHARKYGWDVYFIMQNINQADKQLREALFEYVVRFTRLDRLRVPLVSDVVQGVTAGALKGNLPRLHIGVVRLGSNPDALVADRWTFRGDDLNKVYNTTQVFSDNYPHGTHCLLSPWHLSARTGVDPQFVGPVRPGVLDHALVKPRAAPLKPPHPHMTKFLALALALGVLLGVLGNTLLASPPPPPPPVAQVGTKTVIGPVITSLGFIRNGGDVHVILSDGRYVKPRSFSINHLGEYEAQVDESLLVKGVQR